MLWIILASIIFIINVVWLICHRDFKRSRNIPGVTASDPQLGNLGDVGRAGSLHQYLTQLHQKFGPIVRFYWGEQPVVSIASPEAFHDTRHLFDRPPLLFKPFEPFIGKNSIQFANGDNGHYRRKNHYDAALSTIVLRRQFFDLFQRVLREKINSWQSNNEKTISLHKEMMSLAIRSITVPAIGSSKSFNNTQQIEESYNICWHIMEMTIRGQPMDSKREAEFNKARNCFTGKIKESIAERRQQLGDDDKCFLDYLLEDNENFLSEDHICDEVITMCVGGFHTTGNLLTWALYYLAKDQNVQERLFDELVQTYDTEFPSFEQIDQMSYLTNIINESLRVSVLAPWAARVSTDDPIVICGHTIAAGTPIIQALGVVLQDDKIWKDPHEFNPDRFNQENKKKFPTLAFSPFGFAGKRMCPGYHFAHYESSLFLAGIVRAFKITLVDSTTPVIPDYGLVTKPKDEIYVQFDQRKL